jgi:hypothetical protein
MVHEWAQLEVHPWACPAKGEQPEDDYPKGKELEQPGIPDLGVGYA